MTDFRDTAAAFRVLLRRGQTGEIAAAAGVSVPVVRRVAAALVVNWTAEAELVRVELIARGLCPTCYLADRKGDRLRPWP